MTIRNFEKLISLILTVVTIYIFSVDYFHHAKYGICLGVTQELIPVVLGPQSNLKMNLPPFMIMLVVMATTFFLSCRINGMKSQAEARFPARVSKAALARGKSHPALEDLSGVGSRFVDFC